jgi:hypothetical protein
VGVEESDVSIEMTRARLGVLGIALRVDTAGADNAEPGHEPRQERQEKERRGQVQGRRILIP